MSIDLKAQGFNPYQAYGEPEIKRSPIRAILNKFSLTVSSGYGRTYYRHELNEGNVSEYARGLLYNGNLAQQPDGSYQYSGIGHWLNAPRLNTGISDPDNFNIIPLDTTSLKFSGSGYNIPFQIGLQLDINRFKIGGGLVYEMHRLNELNAHAPLQSSYIPDFNNTSLSRYYFTMGAMVYDFKGWVYHLDMQIGAIRYGKAFDRNQMEHGLYFNLGIPIEYEFSEYFWLFIRPSYDFKNYLMQLPELPNGAVPASIAHSNSGLYVNVGIRIKYPEIPRCPVKSCRVQLKHVHDGREFRGQPIWKKQNPKIGELYPKLHRQKNRNKGKISGGY